MEVSAGAFGKCGVDPAHGSAGGAASGMLRIDQRHAGSTASEVVGDGGADDSGAGDDDRIGRQDRIVNLAMQASTRVSTRQAEACATSSRQAPRVLVDY